MPPFPGPRLSTARLSLLPCMAITLAVMAHVPACAVELLTLDGLGMQVEVPRGWGVLRAVEGRGVSLGPTGDGGDSLDVLVWEPVAENLSSDAAATAHEQVLGTRVQYSRQSVDSFTAADGSHAVLVIGAVRGEQGATLTSMFAAYEVGRRYYVLGTMIRPEELRRVRETYFDRAMRTFSPAGTRLDAPPIPVPVVPLTPEPEPAPPPQPVQPVEPEPLQPEPLEPPEPVEPPAPLRPADGVPAVLTPHRDALGFTIPVPAGWQAHVLRGCAVVWPEESPRRWAAAVWPLWRAGDVPVRDRARAALEDWLQMVGGSAGPVQMRQAAAEGRSVVMTARVDLDGAALRAVATLAAGYDHDLLQVALFPPDSRVEDRLRLAVILRGFESGPAWVVLPLPSEGSAAWVDTEGAVEATVPPGWVVIGGLRTYNDLVGLDIQGRHPASGARFSWRQPELPVYRDLDDNLTAAGWREGAEFPPDTGIEPLVLARRPVAVNAARERALAGGNLTLQDSGPEPQAAALLRGGEGAFAHATDDQTESTCILAVADAPRDLGESCWMAAALRYEGSRSGGHTAAGAALGELVMSARPNPRWPGRDREKQQLRELLEGARSAATSLPARGMQGPEQPGAGVPLYDLVVPEGTAEARRVLPGASASPLWQRATDRGGARAHLPELL